MKVILCEFTRGYEEALSNVIENLDFHPAMRHKFYCFYSKSNNLFLNWIKKMKTSLVILL